MEKISYVSKSSYVSHMMQTTWGNTSVDQEAKKNERESLAKDFIVFCKKGKTTQGNCFQMTSLNDSSCLWAIGVVSSFWQLDLSDLEQGNIHLG